MELNLDRLEPGRSSLELDEILALGPRPAGADVHLQGILAIDSMEGRVLVTGRFQVDREACCDRCASRFRQRFDADIEVMVLRHPGREERADPDDDRWVVHQRVGVVDLRDQLVEAVVLAEPLRALCQEECRGLCTRCGADLNLGPCSCGAETADPRWGPLRRLRDDHTP